MLSEMHVLQSIVCVTFRARGRSLRLGTLKGPSTTSLATWGQPGSPMASEGFLWVSVWVCILFLYPSNCILTSYRALSVGGSAMHMKCPDDIGREAGIGRSQDWKELKLFRACCRVSPRLVEADRPPLRFLLLLNIIYTYIYIYCCWTG